MKTGEPYARVRHAVQIEGEDPSQFEELRFELFDAYEPQGAIEEQLVDMMAGILWRLRRVPALEAAVFSWMRRCHQERSLPLLGPSEAGLSDQTRPGHDIEAATLTDTEKQNLGRAVVHLVRDGDILDKLGRYETQLINQLGRVTTELERLDRRRPVRSSMAGD